MQVSEEEGREFTLHEGDFWGNLFRDDAVAYTCTGERTLQQRNDPILKDKRVCTEIDEQLSGPERRVTRCRFISTGACPPPGAHTIAGERYDEVISVYLKPEN
ncbi:MAG: hypothetical protein OEM00_04860 [Burkholderiaceae bacterium]|nr:hypothetical protein [Burkholderiaceae bacterium]